MSAWPWVAIVGSLLVAAGALLVVVTVGSWPRASRRYDESSSGTNAAPSPAGKASAAPTDEADALWKALDRGEDPTDERP